MKIALDIDGVLADVRGYVEDHLLDKKDWKTYFSHTMEFPIIWQTLFILDAITQNYSNTEVYFITGRPESNRELTELWLSSHLSFSNYILLMRKDGDKNPACEIKLEWLKLLKPDLVIEDDPEAVKLAVENGFAVFQVHGFRVTKEDMVP